MFRAVRNGLLKASQLQRLFGITCLIFLGMGLLIPRRFLSMRNFTSMSFQFAEVGLLSIAMTLSMISGGIDLSVVGTATLSGILGSMLMLHFIPLYPDAAVLIVILAIVVSLMAGVLCGIANGLLVAGMSLPPILVTLGTMQIFTGTAIILTRGSALHGFPDAFLWLGNGYLLGIPVPLVVFVLAMLLCSAMLARTSWGFKLYALGTNASATRFAGVNNTLVLIETYVASGLLSAAAGLIMYSRTNSAKADYGVSYILQAILVAVLGGVNPNGGSGRLLGVLLAILSLQFLSSGFSMLRFSNFFKEFIWGGLLLLVMLMGRLEGNGARPGAIEDENGGTRKL